MSSHVTLIGLWPSLSAFAEDIGLSYNSAKAIKRRGRIPAWYWQACVDGAARRGISGVSLEQLAAAVGSPSKIHTSEHAA
jgi:hypothetical protein